MAIIRYDRTLDTVEMEETKVFVGPSSEQTAHNHEEQLAGLSERIKENKKFYEDMLKSNKPSDRKYEESLQPEDKFLRKQKEEYLDLYNDAKKLATIKLMDFVEFYRLNINDVKSFHFLILNQTTFDSWFNDITEKTLLFKTLEAFFEYVDILSTERGFDVTENWVIEGQRAYRDFFMREYIDSIRENYYNDWKKSREKYTKFVEKGGIRNLRLHRDE